MLLAFCQLLFPKSLHSHATSIEQPIHNGEPGLGDRQDLTLPPLRPTQVYQDGRKLPYLPLAELETARSWRTSTCTGQPIADFMSLQAAENQLRALANAASPRSGVRVRFGPHASYSCFFEVLGRVSVIGSRRFWLDARHTPMTLYFVTFAGRSRLPPR